MTNTRIWEQRLERPTSATSVRLDAPWLVLFGNSCPGCQEKLDTEFAGFHHCGERVSVVRKLPTLVLIIRYPSCLMVRSDKWDRYLVHLNSYTVPFESDSRIPLSAVHSASWAIWCGGGTPLPEWNNPNSCPECNVTHGTCAEGITFRCSCRARLTPMNLTMLESITPHDIEEHLWDERAFLLRLDGAKILFPIQLFQRADF